MYYTNIYTVCTIYHRYYTINDYTCSNKYYQILEYTVNTDIINKMKIAEIIMRNILIIIIITTQFINGGGKLYISNEKSFQLIITSY